MNEFVSLIPRFSAAMWVTLEVSLLAALLGIAGGFLLNALRLRFPRALACPYRVYVWIVRGMPYLSQLVIVYFGLPVIGLTMTAVQATIVSLAFYSAAYFAEIFRAGWASIPGGQMEAARAFGIGRWAAFCAIELPQAIVFLVIKESAVASIITVPELTMTASDIVASTYTYIGPYAMLIVCYWLLTQAVALAARRATALIPFLRKTS
jgi:polar amino acid transport system permease protein